MTHGRSATGPAIDIAFDIFGVIRGLGPRVHVGGAVSLVSAIARI
jgi:hypothetical protein